MDEACAQIDADCQMVFLQQDGNFQEQLNNLEARSPRSRTASSTPLPAATSSTRRSSGPMEAGIPVIASNVDHPGRHPSALLSPARTSRSAGYDLAAGLAPFPEEGPIHVLIGINGPGQVWSESAPPASQRFMEDYIAEHPDREITYERIDAGLDLSVTGQRVAAYVQTTPTTAYFDTGYWAAGAAVSLRDLGKEPGEVLLAGFDLVPVVLEEMQVGLHPADGRPAALSCRATTRSTSCT
jgi:simple sugar transport system substrate-binding protein